LDIKDHTVVRDILRDYLLFSGLKRNTTIPIATNTTISSNRLPTTTPTTTPKIKASLFAPAVDIVAEDVDEVSKIVSGAEV